MTQNWKSGWAVAFKRKFTFPFWALALALHVSGLGLGLLALTLALTPLALLTSLSVCLYVLSSPGDDWAVGDRVPCTAGPQRDVTLSCVRRTSTISQLEQERRSDHWTRLQISSAALRMARHCRRPVLFHLSHASRFLCSSIFVYLYIYLFYLFACFLYSLFFSFLVCVYSHTPLPWRVMCGSHIQLIRPFDNSLSTRRLHILLVLCLFVSFSFLLLNARSPSLLAESMSYIWT